MKIGDVDAVLFSIGLLVKDRCVISFADAVYDFDRFIDTGNRHEHTVCNRVQMIDCCFVISYVNII